MNFWIAISLLLLTGYVVLMVFYFIGWKRTRYFSVPEKFSPETKVSVIIAARNEEKNIESCIRSLRAQDYPKELFKVIVVDDHSEDATLNTVAPIGNDVKIISLLEGKGKKRAIQFGIKNATGKLVITTDADCIANKRWLSTIVSYYEKFQPKMIAAPLTFINENSWIEKWQSLDLCGMMTITAGAITNGFPNMCNGANLAYEKKVFEEVGGFDGIDKQPSGDDVMLMLKIAKKYPGGIHFLKSKEAVVFTQTEKTLNGLFQQRLRWLSKGTAFSDWRVSAVLVFSWLFIFSVLINFIAGFFQNELFLLAAISLLIKTLVELPLLERGCSFFGKRKLLWNILLAEFIHIIYVVVVGGLSRILPTKWRGRVYSQSIS